MRWWKRSVLSMLLGFFLTKITPGQYQPPGCDFNRIVMNFTVTAAGRQFDR